MFNMAFNMPYKDVYAIIRLTIVLDLIFGFDVIFIFIYLWCRQGIKCHITFYWQVEVLNTQIVCPIFVVVLPNNIS